MTRTLPISLTEYLRKRLHNEDTFFHHRSPLYLRIADSGQLTPFCCCDENVGEVKGKKTLNQVHNAEEQRFEAKWIICCWLFGINRSSFHFSLGKGGKNRRRGKNENESEKRELVFKEDGQGFYHSILFLSWFGNLKNSNCSVCSIFLKRICSSHQDVRERQSGSNVFRWRQASLSHSRKTSEKGNSLCRNVPHIFSLSFTPYLRRCFLFVVTSVHKLKFSFCF